MRTSVSKEKENEINFYEKLKDKKSSQIQLDLTK